MALTPGTQITVLLGTEPEQFTVESVDKDCTVHVLSNAAPYSLVMWPTDYRLGATLHKMGQPGTKGW
jgi:hypothetical protein